MIVKINAAGTGFVYQTLLGAGVFNPGVGVQVLDSVSAIAADAEGNAYISGITANAAFPVTSSAYQTALAGPTALFVAKLNPSGSAMVGATLLGGTGQELNTIAPDSNGNVWVSGTTKSTDFPEPLDPLPDLSSFPRSVRMVHSCSIRPCFRRTRSLHR